MNKIYKVVWSRVHKHLVVASELANAASGGTHSGGTLRAPVAARLAAAVLLALGASAAHADVLTNNSFETGDLSGWTAGGGTGTQASGSYGSTGVGASVVTGMTDFDSQAGTGAGTHSWTVTPYGTYMASLQAGDGTDASVLFSTGATALGLTQSSQDEIASLLSAGGGNGTATNAAWLYQDLTLSAGDSFTMAWQYVSTDYTPYNDASLTSLVNLGDSSVLATVNNLSAQYALLGATNPGTGNYSTDSYGATGWEVATYTVSTAGTYRLGFLSFNLSDEVNSPVLLIDQAPGQTFDKGVPFDPIAPNPGSQAPVTPTSSVISAPTTTTDLGTSDATFDGGTLLVDNNTTLDQNFTVNDNGGAIDQAGHDVTLTGTISDDAGGDAGTLTVTNSGAGGSVTLSGTNTYSGATDIDNGATLALAGDGSIADSSGVNADGTFDLTGHNGDVGITSLSGNGAVDLGGNDLHLTDATGSFAGTIGGTGGVSVDSGTEVLSGTNTYTGGTTVGSGATVQIANDANLGDATGGLTLDGGTLHTTADVDTGRGITLNSGGTIQTDTSTTTTDHGGISGNGDLVKTGGGSLIVDGNLSQDGGVQVQGGTLELDGNNTYTGATGIDAGTTLVLGGDSSISDSSGVNADGTLDLAGHNGGVDIASLSGTGTVDLGSNDLHLTDAAGSFCGGIGGDGGVSVASGTETLCGTNTYTGATSVDSGATLALAGDGSIADSSGVNADGTFDLTGHNGDVGITSLSGNGAVDLGGNDLHLTDATGSFAGTIGGTGGVSVDSGTEVLSGTNTYTGGTTVGSGATVQIASDANLGDATGSLTLDGGTLHTTADIDTTRQIHLGSDGGQIDTDAGTSVMSGGDIDGAGALVKNGEGTLELDGVASHQGGTIVNDGTLVLAGDNTYTGGTTLNGGTLQIDRDANLGDAGGDLTFDGGTLHTTGNVNTARNMTLQGGGGTIVNDSGTTSVAGGTFSGAGALTKSGDGVLVLTGDNSYTGGTTIEAGTLRGDTQSLQGDIVDNGTLDFTQAGNGSFGGAISGSGNLVKNGSGTLTVDGVASHQGGTIVNDGTLVLAGDNTYTGGTTLNGGTLQIGRDANLGDASSNLTFNGGSLHTTGNVDTNRDITLQAGNGTIVTDAGTAMTSSGAIGGDGGLIKNGSGKLELDGTASHHGGTIVNDGTLVLAGDNTYTGGTTLNGGSLQISRDANLGDASGNLVFNGGDLTVTDTMSTDRNMRIDAGNASITTLSGVTLTANGDLSGTGGLVKRGGGTLVVTGTNTFSGGTLIDGGDVVIDTGSSLGTGSILLNGGTLHSIATLGSGQTVVIGGNSGINVDAGTTTEFSGQLLTSGATGCFVKSGSGTLNMTGTASLDHGTCVQEGMLRANGELTSQVWVAALGTLRGVGHIQGGLDVHGVLAPGNSPGTLTVAGPVTLHSDATYQVDIDGTGTGTGAGNYSRLLVVGNGNTFTAGGTLAPVLRGITGNASNTFDPSIGDRFLVVQAEGGIVGRFASLAQPTAGLDATERFQAFYTADGHGIELAVTPVSYRDFTATAGANGNAQHTGAAIDAMLAASDAGTATADQQTLLNRMASLTSDQVAGVATGLAGEIHAREAAAARDRFLGLAGEVGDHLAADGVAGSDVRHDTQLWANLGRDGSRFSSDTNADGFKTSQNRSTLGLDAYRGDDALVGLGITRLQTQILDNGGSGDIRGNAMFVYGQAQAGRVQLDGVVSKSADRWSTKRIDPLAGSQLTARADGHTTMTSVTASLPMMAGSVSVAPFARAVWQRVERDGFTESGDAAERLTLDRYSAVGTRLVAGVDLGSNATHPLDAMVTYHVVAAVGRDAGGLSDASVEARLDDVALQVDAPRTGRSFLQLDLNGTLRLSHNAYLYGGITSQTGKGHSSYAATTGIRLAF